jgi:hypothetical protein
MKKPCTIKHTYYHYRQGLWPFIRQTRSPLREGVPTIYEGVSKSFWTGRLDQELQVVQLSATRCSCIALSLSQSSDFYCHNTLCCFSRSVYCCKHIFCNQLNLEAFGYTPVQNQNFVIKEKYGIQFQIVAQSQVQLTVSNNMTLTQRQQREGYRARDQLQVTTLKRSSPVLWSFNSASLLFPTTCQLVCQSSAIRIKFNL